MPSDTIAAIATPPGSGGIGIIRISGPDAVSIAIALFRRSGPDGCEPNRTAPPDALESHRLVHGFIVEPETGRVLDEVLLAAMRAPRSYTREDVVEIQAHAGPAGLRAILERVLACGARPAEAGEFTRRAFLNGRIDLSQAEGVMDLISARSRAAVSAASAQVAGELRREVGAIRDAILNILAHVEAGIDFPEEVGDGLSPETVRDRLETEARTPVAALIQRSKEGRIAREGVRVVVAGRPNVGKSSLMNRLLGTERAIVTAVPGTTRDIVEEQMALAGMSVILADTAGLRETDDPVERIGVERARERLNGAGLVLLVAEATEPFREEDREIADAIGDRPLIWVINKRDLLDENVELPSPSGRWTRWPRILVSAKTGAGVDALLRRMAEAVEPATRAAEHGAIPNLRHRHAFLAAEESLRQAISAIDEGLPLELAAIDLKLAYDRLGDILGETVREDLLDEIFGRFCIGK